MENELLRNQLQSTRNILQTLAGNIDNTILAYNEINRSNYRNRTTEARRNLNNLYQELRNMYPTTGNSNRTNSNTTNLNRTNLNRTNLNRTNSNTTNLNSTNLNSSNLNSSNLNTYNRTTNLDYSSNENNLNRTSAPITTSLNNTLNSLINSRLSSARGSNQPDMIEAIP